MIQEIFNSFQKLLVFQSQTTNPFYTPVSNITKFVSTPGAPAQLVATAGKTADAVKFGSIAVIALIGLYAFKKLR